MKYYNTYISVYKLPPPPLKKKLNTKKSVVFLKKVGQYCNLCTNIIYSLWGFIDKVKGQASN